MDEVAEILRTLATAEFPAVFMSRTTAELRAVQQMVELRDRARAVIAADTIGQAMAGVRGGDGR